MMFPPQAAPRLERVAPSERFLACLNSAADTDITLFLRCRTDALARKTHAGLCDLAGTPPYDGVGARARGLEAAERWYGFAGPVERVRRIGPVAISLGCREIVLRWSHLAGDAWSLQEFLLEALDRVALVSSRRNCVCMRNWRDGERPLSPADAWSEVVQRGGSWRAALLTTWPAISPLLRPARTRLGAASHDQPRDQEAVAVLEMPLGQSAPSGASVFSRVAAVVLALLDGARTRRLGITVDLRRHEMLGRSSGIGNLSCVGYLNATRREGHAMALHGKIQRLLATRFWREQVALDAWLQALPGAATELVANALVRHVAPAAPVTITELWRDDALPCRQCDRPRRRLPEGIDVLALPPALPPAGMTVGITRSTSRAKLVIRRLAQPGESAVGWLHAVITRRASLLAAAGVTALSIQSLAEGLPVT
jgi:hypothetical protein